MCGPTFLIWPVGLAFRALGLRISVLGLLYRISFGLCIWSSVCTLERHGTIDGIHKAAPHSVSFVVCTRRFPLAFHRPKSALSKRFARTSHTQYSAVCTSAHSLPNDHMAMGPFNDEVDGTRDFFSAVLLFLKNEVSNSLPFCFKCFQIENERAKRISC